MDDQFETLLRYIPASVLRKIATRSARLNAPEEESFQAAALYADVAGFAVLVEQIAQRGAGGVEELSRLFNDYFAELIQIIAAYQGEVIRFTGDGLLAIWPVSEDSADVSDSETDSPLAVTIYQAGQCGLAIQSALSDYRYKNQPDAVLALRLGVGAGNITAAHIGGVFGRWEYVLVGTALAQTGFAGNHARPGEVILSPQAWQIANVRSRGQMVEEGCVRLVSISANPTRTALPAPELVEKNASDLRAYLPGALLNQLDRLQAGSNLAEIRRLTVLNILIPDLTAGPLPLAQAQSIMQTLQKALYRYEGSINRLFVNEKGVQLIAALGLPPFAHEDDPSRGAQAALAMRRELYNLGLSGTIGVATGRVFCGSIGNPTRQEYVVVGGATDLANRLAQVAVEPQSGAGSTGAFTATFSIPILCDRNTYQAARAQIDFESLPPVRVKGRLDPVAIYIPVRLKKSLLRSRADMIGRVKERSLLAESLQSLLRTQKTQVIVIEAEAGMGKTRLVEHLMKQAGQMQIDVLYGNGEAIEMTTSYFAWRKIFSQAFGINELAGSDEIQRRVLDSLAGEENLTPLAALINGLLPVSFQENELTTQMSGQVRADNTSTLLLRLIMLVARNTPKVLVIEDAQWLDSASWSLLYHASQQVKSLLIVIANRPDQSARVDEHTPSDYQRICSAPNCQIIHLKPLNNDEIIELVSQHLGVAALPQLIIDVVLAHTKGHPFYAEELGYALRDMGLIEIEDGECRLPGGSQALLSARIPGNLEGLILSRIQPLDETQKLLLQIASVIGRVFTFQTLQEIYSGPEEGDQLLEDMEVLDQLDITPVELTEQGLTYVFKHAVTQDVIYRAIPEDQRRLLHRAAAEWYEKNHAQTLELISPILVYHWVRALNSPKETLETPDTAEKQITLRKAVETLEGAAGLLLGQGLYHESIDFLTQALEYEVALSERYPALTRANWERMIAEAYYGLGKTQPALQHLTNALQILDLPAPRNKSGLLFNVAVSILQRIWSHFSRRTLPPSQIIPATTIHERTSLQGARIYDQLAALYFFANDNLRLVHSVLQAVNLTESLGPSAGLARGYASVCVAAGTIPIHFIAQNYSRMAIETARLINQPSALAHAMLYTNIYSIGIGEWAKTIPENQEAAKVFKDLGDHYRLGETQTGLGLAHYFQGDFAQSLSTFKLVEENASRSNNTLQLAWGLGGMAMAKVRLGFPDDGIQLAQRTLQALEIAIDQSEEIRAYAAMEWGMFNKGDWQAALEIYHTLQSTINGKVSPVYSVMEGYAIQVLLPLAIWEAWVDPERAYLNNVINRPGSQGEWKNEAQKALQVFHKFAGVFPIGKARVLLYQGLFDWLYGQVQSAYTNWMESLQIARRMEMPYEEGLACLELGRHTIGEAQKEFLEFGARIFERCNAAFELELIQTLLSNQQDSSI